jgi:hypothetical protein
MKEEFTRRDFLKASGLGLAGAGLTMTLAQSGVWAAQGSHDSSRLLNQASTNATYYNDASFNAADPYVLYDEGSGYYYAYSTDGGGQDAAGRSYYFGIYRSADLATWEQIPGGALPRDDPKQWGNDWFWAPEVYHNPNTGLYFLFYAARSDANAERWFAFADFQEPCKVGVAMSASPEGPFLNIADEPIDYWPYDPDYHDVNQIMAPDQMKPPATLEEGQTAPLGVYIPFIDPNVFFDDGRLYLYYSRNAYRNWVWDYDLGKYIEESNIYAVELTTDWWNDASGRTMPSITPAYVNANNEAGYTSRRDGFVRILDYGSDKQAWENAHVNDYATSGGTRKDRRWEEGSTTIKSYVDRDGSKEAVYYLTYSANNWENPDYGVGYATATSPLGPWKKYPGNPILAKDPSLPMYSTGHGSIASSPDSSQTYYVHHGRPSATGGPRKLYTERLFVQGTSPDPNGNPTLVIDQTTSDRPVPSGVAPYSMSASATRISRSTWKVRWQVASASGTRLALANPLNRVTTSLDRPGTVTPDADGQGATVTLSGRAAAQLTLTYQRQKASGAYEDVYNIVRTKTGTQRRVPVSKTVSLPSEG